MSGKLYFWAINIPIPIPTIKRSIVYSETTSSTSMSQMKTLINTQNKNKSAPKVIVPRHRRDKTGHARTMGYNAEVDFQQKCKTQQYTWEKASKSQNCEQHTDCFIITPKGMRFSVDVKAAKKIARYDQKPQDKYTWVEWIRRDGEKGWAQSDVDYIAFQMLTGDFLMVKTKELRDHVAPLIEKYKRIVRVDSQHDAKNGILWRRKGNQDAMTLIETDELALLPSSYFI